MAPLSLHTTRLYPAGEGKDSRDSSSSWLRDLSIAAFHPHRQPAAASDITYSHTVDAFIHTLNSLFSILQATQFCSLSLLPTVTTRFVAGLAKGDSNQVCPSNILQSDQPTIPTAHTLRERQVAADSELYLRALPVLRPHPLLRRSHHCIHLSNLFRLLDFVLHLINHSSFHSPVRPS